MAGLFTIPTRAGREADSVIAKKATTKAKIAPTTVKGSGGLLQRISEIVALVEKNLGYLRDKYLIITEQEVLHSYISACIEAKYISIDTETTGLDPLVDSIVGICINTRNQKPAYIPINHISYITGVKIENQLSVDIIREEFERLIEAHPDIDMYNSTFDMRVLRKWVGLRDIYCTWDGYLAARLLNENEESNALKKLHQKYVLNGEGDAFKFDDLFKGITFDKVPIKTAYLYAAHDPEITTELCDYQRPFLTKDNYECTSRGLENIAWIFHNIEMPVASIVADMEDTGVELDLSYADELHNKYHRKLQEAQDKVYSAIAMYDNEIAEFRRKHVGCKLDDPINLDSPKQLAILLYDIMGCKVVDDKNPRGTGDDILDRLDNVVTKALQSYREVAILIKTFIDKLPTCVNPKDGRIHCKFNQYGADTGRFSSQDPNLQNIPSHNHDIRKMFKATDGYVLMSSDYSQQEPKVMAQLCGDPKMLEAYKQGKDLYAEIASLSFHTAYENCLEFRPDGTTNPEGKNRRSQAKSILLGVLYGRGIPSIAEQLGCSVKEAQKIKDSVFEGFPAIKQFEEDSIYMAENYGFVTTLWGRKRRLPAMMLPDYEVTWKDGAPIDDDPLAFDTDDSDKEVPWDIQKRWIAKVKSVPFRDKRKVFEAANEEGLWIIDHTRDKDTTKVVNARIQGSAADMSKLAMIKVGTDKQLKEWGFRLLIPVHDELIGECPEEHAKECAERFAHLMSIAAVDKLTIPISCDVEITKVWYGDKISI